MLGLVSKLKPRLQEHNRNGPQLANSQNPSYTSRRSLAWPQSRLESKFPRSIRSRVPGAGGLQKSNRTCPENASQEKLIPSKV